MKKEFNLSDKRMELFREMCKVLPDFKWGLLFERIQEQDKEFIRLLKEGLFVPHGETTMGAMIKRIDALAGEELTG